MAVGVEETEQLLARLEAELAPKQAQVDARLAREKARLDALEAEVSAFLARRRQAEATLATAVPERDAWTAKLARLEAEGSRGNRARAAFWASVAMGLTAVATICLPAVGDGGFVCPVAGFGCIAVALGWLVGDLVTRRRW